MSIGVDLIFWKKNSNCSGHAFLLACGTNASIIDVSFIFFCNLLVLSFALMIRPDVTMCDQMWRVWPDVTGVTRSDQVRPDAIVVTRCDMGDLMWLHVTRCGQMWQGWPGVIRCDQLGQIWPGVTSSEHVTRWESPEHASLVGHYPLA